MRGFFLEKSMSHSTDHNKFRSIMHMETMLPLALLAAQRWEHFPQLLCIFLPFFPHDSWFATKKYLRGFRAWTSVDSSKYWGNGLGFGLSSFLSISKRPLVFLWHSLRMEFRTQVWNFIITFLALISQRKLYYIFYFLIESEVQGKTKESGRFNAAELLQIMCKG